MKYLNRFLQGVKNLLYWIPIIWKDRNYDHGYIYDILEHKLKAQYNYLSQGNWSELKYDRLKTCIKLIDKVKNDYYSLEVYDYYKTKHTFEDNGKTSSLKTEVLENNLQSYFDKYPKLYKRFKNDFGNHADTELKIAYRISMELENKARNLLFKLISNNIYMWWD